MLFWGFFPWANLVEGNSGIPRFWTSQALASLVLRSRLGWALGFPDNYYGMALGFEGGPGILDYQRKYGASASFYAAP